MTPEHRDRNAPNGKTISFILLDGRVWFSQASLARLFSKTKANISLHLKDISERASSIEINRDFRVGKLEGRRNIVRVITHYSLEAAHMIALRSQHWDEHNWLMELAREFDAQRTEFRVVPIKERDFRELIETLLHGIVKVECQYAVGMYSIDFYLPELGLAIEYDESHHARPQSMVADKNREKAIRQAMPNIQFIRVQERRELVGINEVLRILVKKSGLKRHSRRGLKSTD
jgi:very-short-patch-repair endonuclease